MKKELYNKKIRLGGASLVVGNLLLSLIAGSIFALLSPVKVHAAANIYENMPYVTANYKNVALDPNQPNMSDQPGSRFTSIYDIMQPGGGQINIAAIKGRMPTDDVDYFNDGDFSEEVTDADLVNTSQIAKTSLNFQFYGNTPNPANPTAAIDIISMEKNQNSGDISITNHNTTPADAKFYANNPAVAEWASSWPGKNGDRPFQKSNSYYAFDFDMRGVKMRFAGVTPLRAGVLADDSTTTSITAKGAVDHEGNYYSIVSEKYKLKGSSDSSYQDVSQSDIPKITKGNEKDYFTSTINGLAPDTEYTVQMVFMGENQGAWNNLITKTVDIKTLPITNGKVITKYVDENGTDISTSTNQIGKIDDPYTTSPINIPDYALDVTKLPANARGKYTQADQTVTYIYKKVTPQPINNGRVITKYVDENGSDISTSTTQVGRIDDPYVTSPIDISGYALDTNKLPGNANGKYTQADQTVTYIYKKVTPQPVNNGRVTTKYIDDAGNDISTSVMQIGRIDDQYATSPIDISGYALDTSKLPGNANGKYSQADQTVTYIYKKVTPQPVNNGRVTTKYIDDAGNDISTSVMQIGRIDDPYATSPIDISGYALDTSKLPGNANGKYTQADQTVTYIYKKVTPQPVNNGKVITKYVDETGTDISQNIEKTGRIDDPYTTNPIDIPDYALHTSKLPGNANGKYTQADQTVTYIYKKVTPQPVNNGKVITKYVDETGTDISQNIEKTGRIDDPYTTNPIDIPDYALDTSKLPGNANGKYTQADQTVTYIYKKVTPQPVNNGKVITKYVVETGNDISQPNEQLGRVSDPYTTNPIDVSGYALDTTQLPQNANGKYTQADQTVTYIYKKVTPQPVNNGKVITKYVDETGTDISQSIEKTGRIDDPYTTNPIDIADYALDTTQLPLNVSGKYMQADQTVTYIYKKVTPQPVNNGKVVTKYVDETGTDINQPSEQLGRVGDPYTTNPIDISDYALDTSKLPGNTSGKYTQGDQTVTYIYKKVTPQPVNNGKVVTKYVDETGTDINQPNEQLGRVSDPYTTNPIDISDYALDTSKLPGNASGKYTQADQTVTYIYKKAAPQPINNGKVTTKYVDENGTEISKASEQLGRVNDPYVTSPMDIGDYALDTTQLPKNASGKYTQADQTVTYIYKKPTPQPINNGKVTTKYVDENGTEISKASEQLGRVNDPYVTSPMDIGDYALDTTQLPKNASGKYTQSDQTVTYIYQKTTPQPINNGKVITKYLDEKGNEIKAQRIQIGRINDPYTTSAIDIAGYALDLNKIPTNKDGKYSKAEEIVTYVYKKVTSENIKNGEITIKYVDESGKELTKSTTQIGRIGDSYTTSPIKINGFSLDTNKLPEKQNGIYQAESQEITYVYKKVGAPYITNDDSDKIPNSLSNAKDNATSRSIIPSYGSSSIIPTNYGNSKVSSSYPLTGENKSFLTILMGLLIIGVISLYVLIKRKMPSKNINI